MHSFWKACSRSSGQSNYSFWSSAKMIDRVKYSLFVFSILMELTMMQQWSKSLTTGRPIWKVLYTIHQILCQKLEETIAPLWQKQLFRLSQSHLVLIITLPKIAMPFKIDCFIDFLKKLINQSINFDICEMADLSYWLFVVLFVHTLQNIFNLKN